MAFTVSDIAPYSTGCDLISPHPAVIYDTSNVTYSHVPRTDQRKVAAQRIDRLIRRPRRRVTDQW
jgi:hypothetical protein